MRPKIALDLMAEGFFLPTLFAGLSSQPHQIFCALYGPCEYWQAWYESLSIEKKSFLYPYHQPLSTSLAIKTLAQKNYQLAVTTTPIRLSPKDFLEFEEPVALWHYDAQKQIIFVTLSIFPLNLLSLEQWLTLYSIAKNLTKTIFLEKESQICVPSIDTGNIASEHFLSLKSCVKKIPGFEVARVSTLLLEPLSFQTLLTCSTQPQKLTPKSQFNWFQKKEVCKNLSLQGFAQKRSVYAYAAIDEASELIPLIDWAFAAGSLMPSI